jgi:hypothetical protein
VADRDAANARLDLAAHRRLVLERFSGILCVDEVLLDVYWQQASRAAAADNRTRPTAERPPPQSSVRSKKKVA